MLNTKTQRPGCGTIPSFDQAHAMFTVGLLGKGSEKVVGLGGLPGKAGVEQDPGGKGQTAL